MKKQIPLRGGGLIKAVAAHTTWLYVVSFILFVTVLLSLTAMNESIQDLRNIKESVTFLAENVRNNIDLIEAHNETIHYGRVK